MLTPLVNIGLAQAQESVLNDLRNSSENERRNDDRIFVLRNGTGQCFVCQVDFTSDQNAKQHLDGKKHKKNVASRQLMVLGPRVEGPISTSQPINGGFPPNSWLPAGASGGQGNVTQPNVITASPTTSCQGAGESPLLQPARDIRGPNGEEYFMNGSKGFCYVCQIQLTSFEHKESHIHGQKHKKKCLQTGPTGGENKDSTSQRLSDILSNTDGVLMCSLCNVPFSCLANAEEHFASNKHKKKAMMKESMGPGAHVPVRQETSASNYDHTSPKVVTDTGSPFVPLRNVSVEETVSESGFTRVNPNQIVPSSAQEITSRVPLVHPVPQRAILAPQTAMPDPVPQRAMPDPAPQRAMFVSQFSPDRQPPGFITSPQTGMPDPVPQKTMPDPEPQRAMPVPIPQKAMPVPIPQRAMPDPVPQRAMPDPVPQRAMPDPVPQRAMPDSIPQRGMPDPVPQRAMPVSQFGADLQHPGLNTSPDTTLLKEVNTSKIEGILHRNLISGVAEIEKIKNKELLDAGGPTSQSDSFEPGSVIDNARYPQNIQRSPKCLNETACAQLESPVPPYVFNSLSEQGYCNVCNVDLTSRQLADQHLNGQKHQKKAAFWTCSQQNQTFLHPMARSTPVTPNIYTDRQVGQSSGVGASPVGGVEDLVLTSPVQLQDQPDETCLFTTSRSRGFCVACEIEINSVQHFDQHRLGKRHNRNRQRYLLSQQGKVYPLECDVCKKIFTGQESAQQHFSSARHKSKMEIMGEGGREVERLENGRMIMRDSQIWYVCDICDCPLNTREQFEIHKASPRHNKALETKMARVELEVEMLTATTPRPQENEQRGPQVARSPFTPNLSTKERKEGENVLESNLQHLLFKPHSATNSQLMQGENQWNFAQMPNKPAGFANTTSPCHPNAGRSEQAFLPAERYGPDMRAWSHTNVPKQGSRSPDPCNAPQQMASSQSHIAYQGITYHPRSTARENTHTASHNESTGSAGGDYSNTQINDTNVESIRGSQTQSPSGISSPGFDDTSDEGFPGIAGRPVMRRGNSSRSQGPPFRDITTMEQRLSDDELWEDSVEEADREVEKMNFNISESDVVDDLESNLQNLHISDAQPADSVIERSTKPGFKHYCKVCMRHMNTKENLRAHVSGKVHKYNVSTIRTPQRQLPPVQSVITEGVVRRGTLLTKDTPRPYQLELLQKAMARDTVIYLPTGTGKTLVAVLTIGLMLQENKTRPVLFLVDKVLLVLQQEKYIRQQFEGRKFTRPDVNRDGAMVERELLVMAICGGLFSNRGIPIWKHDIIVTTADFCMNMLERGWICWEDFSMVVLDEVHHCLKNHPYLRLFAKYHHQPQQQQQLHYPSTTVGNGQGQNREHPKVLGLSASPASKDTVKQTHVLLRNLLANLGGAHIAMVEEETRNLDTFQSSAEVIPICVPMSDNERDFTLHLLQYALKCYIQLAHLCPTLKNFKTPPYSYFAAAVQGNEEDIICTAENLMKDIEPLMEITTCLFGLKCPLEIEQDQDRSWLFKHLMMHLEALLLLVRDIGSNSAFVAASLLKELEPSEKVKLFEKHSLPCSSMYQKVEHFAKYGSKDMTMYNKLIATLNNPLFVDWDVRSCKALVLIQKRQEAKQLAHMLKDTEFVKERHLQVSHLVGHGKGAQDGGMDVKKQKKVIDNQDRFHLIVATSIMEEGIDFQTLQLVVCMNPPTSVRALVQIRGRARRRDSHFVILCKTEEEKQKLKNLLQQEQNMAEAAKLCLMEDCRAMN